jgi:hypothetical protein
MEEPLVDLGLKPGARAFVEMDWIHLHLDADDGVYDGVHPVRNRLSHKLAAIRRQTPATLDADLRQQARHSGCIGIAHDQTLARICDLPRFRFRLVAAVTRSRSARFAALWGTHVVA